MIKRVTPKDIMQAAVIHSESWKESHRDICSAEFIEIHTPERQKRYLESETAKGARLYMLFDGDPKGIVSVLDGVIANLYVLPAEQNKGYGTRLLEFAVGECTATPSLWVLNTNAGAKRFYERNGFKPTGNVKQIADGLYELELSLEGQPDSVYIRT